MESNHNYMKLLEPDSGRSNDNNNYTAGMLQTEDRGKDKVEENNSTPNSNNTTDIDVDIGPHLLKDDDVCDDNTMDNNSNNINTIEIKPCKNAGVEENNDKQTNKINTINIESCKNTGVEEENDIAFDNSVYNNYNDSSTNNIDTINIEPCKNAGVWITKGVGNINVNKNSRMPPPCFITPTHNAYSYWTLPLIGHSHNCIKTHMYR